LSSADWSTFNGKYTLPSLTNGSVLFSNGTTIAQDNANFFWDDTNNRLGIGTNSPQYGFHYSGVRFYQSGTTTTAATTFYNIADNTTANNSYVIFGVDINGGTTGFSVAGTYLSTGKNGTGTARALILHNYDSQPIIFATNNTERGRIFGTGNFGIGTGATDDGQKFQVVGSAKITGAATFGSTSSFASTATFSVDASINSLNIGRGGGSLASNTRLGTSALNANTTGTNNIALGFQSLLVNNTGSSNVGVGYQSLLANTTGGNNTAIGYQSLVTNVVGNNCTAIGNTSLYLNTGNSNTAVGVEAMYYNTTGTGNVGMGYQGLQRNTSGAGNTAIGFQAGGATGASTDNTTGSNNIFIGNLSLGESATESNRTWIGNTSTTSTWVGGSLLIGTRTDVASSILTLASNSKGFLPPRMTNAERTAISSPAVGLMVYCTDAVEGLYVYKSTGWTFVI
jgi:hypothetical protein